MSWLKKRPRGQVSAKEKLITRLQDIANLEDAACHVLNKLELDDLEVLRVSLERFVANVRAVD